MKWLHKCIIKSSSNSACIGSGRCGGGCYDGDRWREKCYGGCCELGLSVHGGGGEVCGEKMFDECSCAFWDISSARSRS